MVRLVALAGILYRTQFHLVLPSPGKVDISSAKPRVPAGVFDQDSAGLDPFPSHVYSAGSVPPSAPASLVKTKDVDETEGDELVELAPVLPPPQPGNINVDRAISDPSNTFLIDMTDLFKTLI